MTVTTRDVNVRRIPSEAIDVLIPAAIRKGHSPKSDSALVRFAVIELAERIRRENGTSNGAPDTGD